jgi:hypothetical protein
VPDKKDEEFLAKLNSDEELLGELRQAISARRAVPPEFVEAAKNAFMWHNIDAELAQLTYDSTRTSELAAATRSETASIRALTFTSARLTIELEVAEDSVLGQIVPAQLATIEVQAQDGPAWVIPTDEIGCFSINPIPDGPFRLRCHVAAGADILTGLITL